MNCVGVIAEYNPFHNGHRYMLTEAKRLTGADTLVACMSASFVQRGEPGMADKFTRAKWALENGADIVIELPDVFSCACAERFASGAVRILLGAGVMDALCFGSECGDTELLRETAFADADPDKLREALARGLSYPRAVAEAGAGLSPNDILGVEYLRALKRYSPDTPAFAVKRIGGYDDRELAGEYSSAAAIRRALAPCADIARISPKLFDSLCSAMPRGVLEDIAGLIHEGVCPAGLDRLSPVLLYKLRSMSAEDIAELPEVSEGLENLFKKYSAEEGDCGRMLEGVKSKRYTMARLKRICMCALLGVTEELQAAAHADDRYLYARVLGIREDASPLLARMSERAKIPVIAQASDRNALCPEARRVESISALAHRIRALANPYELGVREDAPELLGELAEKAALPVVIRSADRNSLNEKAARVMRISELAHRIFPLARPYEYGAEEDAGKRLVTV